MQSRKESAIESVVNTSVGFAISLIAVFIILPLFGVVSTAIKNIGITICFTVISLLRGFLIRRYFNRKLWQEKKNTKED